MKKLLIASIVFILLSCDTEPMNETNPLIGTWENSTEYDIETFKFTDNMVIGTYQIKSSQVMDTFNGTYQYYDKVIIFRWGSRIKILCRLFNNWK